jgi:hypothetical protein
MHALHAGGLSPDDFAHGGRQRGSNRFLVSILGNILSVLQPVEHGMIIAAQRDLCIDPCTMQGTLGRPGYFLLRLAQSHELRLEFFGEFSAFRTDLDEK